MAHLLIAVILPRFTIPISIQCLDRRRLSPRPRSARPRCSSCGRAVDHTVYPIHNQTTAISLHRRLVEMWAPSTRRPGTRRNAVFPQNNQIRAAIGGAQMLVAGEIQFFTLMGGILAPSFLPPKCSRYRSRSGRPPSAPGDGRSAWRLSARRDGRKGIFGFPSGRSTTGCARLPGQSPSRSLQIWLASECGCQPDRWLPMPSERSEPSP